MRRVRRIADIQYANGGSLELLPHLSEEFDNLEVYWAWNTTANTLGTTFLHAAIVEVSKRRGVFDERINKRILAERIVEEAIYQPIVRPLLKKKLLERGDDPFNLPETLLPTLLEVTLEMLRGALNALELPFQVVNLNFPLRRIFEIDFEVAFRDQFETVGGR